MTITAWFFSSRLRLMALLALALVAAQVGTARAETRNLRYSAYWGGMHAADFLLSYNLDSAQGRYESQFRLETLGLFRWLSKLWANADSQGVLDLEGLGLSSKNFDAHYQSRRRERRIKVVYDLDGGEAVPEITTVAAEPEQDEANEGKVPSEFRHNVTDPLAALVSLVVRLRDHVHNGGPADFTIPVYDGRRRYDLVISYQGRTGLRIWQQRYTAYKLLITAKPQAGFKDRHKKQWEESAFDIYISDDGQFTPLQIFPHDKGPVINLAEICPSAVACTPSAESPQ